MVPYWPAFSLHVASLNVGNILPVGRIPEGTAICNVEEKYGDRGRLARCSGNAAQIVSHNPDTKRTRVKLPSGSKKVLPSTNRAMIGIVAGGGRTDKKMLKAGRAYHKFRVKRNCWPKVNLVIHSHFELYLQCLIIRTMSVTMLTWFFSKNLGKRCCYEPCRASPWWW